MAIVVTGVITEKKEKLFTRNGVDSTKYQLYIACLGFTLVHEVEMKTWFDYKEGEIVKLRISPKNSSKAVKERTYNFFEPVVTGMKKGHLKEITDIPKGQLGVMVAELISLGVDEEGNDKGNYSKMLFEGDLVGEMTGAEDLGKDLKPYTQYECNMGIGYKRGVLQIMPSNFKEVGAFDEEF